jgi:hypothetical protein
MDFDGERYDDPQEKIFCKKLFEKFEKKNEKIKKKLKS